MSLLGLHDLDFLINTIYIYIDRYLDQENHNIYQK